MSGRWASPTIEGELVRLRPVVAGDAATPGEAGHDPGTRERQDGRLDLAVVERATGEHVGEVVLHAADPESDSAHLRIALRDADRQARGLGDEATRLVVDHGLRTMGLAQITLDPGLGLDDGDGERAGRTIHASRLAPSYPLETDRLRLRPLDRPTDVADMHAYRSNPEVCRFVPFTPGTLDEMAERFENPDRVRSAIDAEGQVLSLAIERRDTGQMIGDLVLFWHGVADGHAEVGYVLHPDHAGLGFATEATAALLDLAVDGGLPVHRVTARLDERNGASAAVCRRLGMRLEASYVEGEWFKGEWTTLQVYAVLAREWRERRNTSHS